jgi:YYY domain-containing protein
MTPFDEIWMVVRWWLALLVLGTAVTPFTLHLLHRLPDRGYAFTKLLGLLLTSHLFWLLGSLGILGNNLGGILVALLAVVGLSVWAWQQGRAEITGWLRANWRYVLLTELLFLVIFLAWAWVRAQNPAIVATEKPMDFAFLNAIGRSPSFPPLDPWLSGYAISYYYFGYLMQSVLARLTAVPEPYAFNLAIAWLVAGTAVGAFGLTYNLVAAYGQQAKRAAIALGLVAAIAIPIAGNLEIVLEAAHGYGYGTPEFWAWLDVRDLNTPPDPTTPPRYENAFWWWWRSSRPINEYSLSGQRIEGLEPIVEFPAFSFVLGDLHPHVMALPFAFLSLGMALAWFLAEGRWSGGAEEQGGEEKITSAPLPLGSSALRLIQEVGVPLWLLTAVILGGLSFLNTWDVLIHLFVVLGAFTLAQWRSYGWSREILVKTFYLALLLVIPAVLMYLPFYFGFRSQAGAPFLLPMLNRPTRLAQFLIVFGLPLGTITILLLVLAVKQRFRQWKVGLATAVTLLVTLFLLSLLFSWIVAASAEGAGRVINLAAELGIPLAPRADGFAPGWAVTAVFALLPTYLQARLAYPALTLLLAALLALAVMVLVEEMNQRRDTEAQSNENKAQPQHLITSAPPPLLPPLPFALLLIITGILLTLGPEFLYLRDNFGVRLNTIFKFYYQAWALFGIAAIFGLYALWQATTGVKRVVPALVTAGYGVVLLLSLLFPFYAIQSRAVEFRGQDEAEFRQPPTLNGLAAMQNFNFDEYAAIQWLRENVAGTPAILEAVGGQYSEYGRVSASTGLPTLLGWAGHEYQWRGSSTQEPAVREPAVRDIFTAPNWDGSNAALLLNEYGVELIYIGNLERTAYSLSGPALQKFSDRLEVAYQNNSVTIYRWLPEEGD